jgi:hypothetical protein
MTAAERHIASCACGGLRVIAAGDPDIVVACNCTACQRRTGSPFGVGAYYRKESIVAITGEDASYHRTAESGRSLNFHFCPRCGTTVYWTQAMRPDHVGVAVGCFADPDFMPPARAVWSDHRHGWLSFPDDMPVYPRAAP